MHSPAFTLAVSFLLPLQFGCLAMQLMADDLLPAAVVQRAGIERFLCGLSGMAWLLGGAGPLLALASGRGDANGSFALALLGVASSLTLYGHWALLNGEPKNPFAALRLPLLAAVGASFGLGSLLALT